MIFFLRKKYDFNKTNICFNINTLTNMWLLIWYLFFYVCTTNSTFSIRLTGDERRNVKQTNYFIRLSMTYLITLYRMSCWIFRRQLLFLVSTTNLWRRLCWTLFLFTCIVSSCLWLYCNNRLVQVYLYTSFKHVFVIINHFPDNFALIWPVHYIKPPENNINT